MFLNYNAGHYRGKDELDEITTTRIELDGITRHTVFRAVTCPEIFKQRRCINIWLY